METTHSLIDQRLTSVEITVREIQRRLAIPPPPPNWLEQITGSFKDEPAFEEALALGRALRAEDRLPEGIRKPE